MKIEISDHFTIGKMIKFTVVPIVALLFCSVYSVIDGIFISNNTNANSFAAVNLMAPYTLLFPAFGFMIGSGGNAIISKLLGEKNKEEANRVLSMLVYFSIALSLVLLAVALLCAEPFAVSQGAEGEVLSEAMLYGRIMLLGLPFFVLQFEFQNFCIAADKSEKGFLFMLLSGIINIIFDALFIIVFQWGVVGAAVASVMGQIAGGLGPVIMFIRAKKDELHIVKTKISLKYVLKACSNGSSEMLSNLATSIVCIFYNFQLMRIIGVEGVDAYGVIQYIMMLFGCVFMGYCMGIGPVIGYNYGADNKKELKNVVRGSIIILLIYEIVLFAIAEIFTVPLSEIFLNSHENILDMTVYGFRICAFSTLTVGINMFASALFTALSNGLISAILATARSLVLPIAAVFTLPLFWNLDGVWFSVLVAEIIAIVISLIMMKVYKSRYGY